MENKRPEAITPYNFIPFPEKIIYRYNSFEELPSHSYIDDSNLESGWIEYTVSTMTPLFIGDGNKEFFKIDGKHVIPGSTMKGRIRTNAEILSNSEPQFIGDQHFWYRGFADKCTKLKDEYDKNLKNKTVNGKQNLEDSVRAGYLKKNGSRYVITPAQKDESGRYFQRIHESKLRKMDIAEENVEEIFMYKNIDWDEIYKLKKKRSIGLIDSKLRNDKKTNKNTQKAFKPYHKKIYYETTEAGVVKNISTKSNSTWKVGYLVNSTNLGNKQVHYLIFDKNSEQNFKVSKKVVAEYEVNVQYRNSHEKRLFDIEENKGNSIAAFSKIDDKNKPVFYKVNLEETQIEVMGFTPYLKIPYKNSIRKGVLEESGDQIDYAKSLFGMTEPKAYKSRLMFDNLELQTRNEENTDSFELPLTNPKATSFQLYLKQPDDSLNKLKTYNDDDFELRGYKFYYLKENHHLPIIDQRASKNYLTTIKPITDATFKGKIYFKNLHEDELGLLLMSLKPFKTSFDSIGQGKPFGFGKVNIQISEVIIEDKDSLDNEFDDVNLEEPINLDELKSMGIIKKNSEDIEKYVKSFKEQLEMIADEKIFKLDNETLEAFHYSKTKDVNIEAHEYMKLKEFKNREVLSTVKDLKYFDNKTNSTKSKKYSRNDNIENLGKHLKNANKTFNKNLDNSMYELQVQKYKSIVVLSKNLSEEHKLKPIFRDFSRVDYNTLEKVKRLSKYDIVIFNNYGSEEEQNEILKIMKKNPDKAYLYFNDQKRFFNGDFEGAFHFSSTKVTLYNAIVDLARYADKIK